MNIPKKQIKEFQKKILEWYGKHKRDLPWRDVPVAISGRSGASLRDPYKILVSEVMSQQTQLSRVVPKYLAWMERFPTLQSLADAPTSEVLRYWSGLGYNRRALYLKKCAEVLLQKVPKEPKGPKVKWPQTEEELRHLPGIGEYTARAILCFAFGKQVAVLDTNIRKVILVHFFSERLKGVEEPSTSSGKNISHKEVQSIADQLLPNGQAYVWNQALMDYATAMLKDHKIPIPKQSHFKTSNRFYRGQVIRLLLNKDKQNITELFKSLENNGISKEKFEEILRQMEKDGLLIRDGFLYALPEE